MFVATTDPNRFSGRGSLSLRGGEELLLGWRASLRGFEDLSVGVAVGLASNQPRCSHTRAI